ncbi:MAG: sugar isomerase [Thaumarchaeota archaeon]|nr:sugar isomerase [Nitrososphaerota archaeon]
MKTIEAYEKDIILQTQFLQIFKPQSPITKVSQQKTIFCGSGDSFAAALLAEAFSDLRVRAVDPLELIKNKQIAKLYNVFLVSISGNTISNIKVAKFARESVAITSNPKSRLAKACKRTIDLKFLHSDGITGGSLSFLQSALTCISLVTNFTMLDNPQIFKKALAEARKVKFVKRVFLLGNLHTYPLAMYGAAKFYELLGLDAHYERIEQFSHMGLFSTKKDDTVILLEEKNSHNEKLVKNLKKIGLRVFHPTFNTNNKITQFLFYTFFTQLVPLLEAKRKKQNDCHFVTSTNLRKISDNMIY